MRLNCTKFFNIMIFSEVNIEKQLVCEPCSGKVLGGFDSRASQVLLSVNKLYAMTSTCN